MNIFWEALKDACIDTAWVLPFLYLAYLIVGYFSHNDNEKYAKILHHTKKGGPLVGAFLGCVPQCGFSSVMSQLYSNKIVTLGTLLAVFIATSDEAIPLMVAKPQFIPKLLILIAIKVGYAIIVGYAIDFVLYLFNRKKPLTSGEYIEPHHHEHGDCCAKNIFLDALKHTVIIALYVFLASLALNLVIGYAGGMEPLKKLFTDNQYLQILIACVIGLIPNCAASVFLVEFYMSGVVTFSALVAGLSAGAGVGLITLFSINKSKILKNFGIVGLLYVLSVGLGFLTTLFNII